MQTRTERGRLESLYVDETGCLPEITSKPVGGSRFRKNSPLYRAVLKNFHQGFIELLGYYSKIRKSGSIGKLMEKP